MQLNLTSDVLNVKNGSKNLVKSGLDHCSCPYNWRVKGFFTVLESERDRLSNLQNLYARVKTGHAVQFRGHSVQF